MGRTRKGWSSHSSGPGIGCGCDPLSTATAPTKRVSPCQPCGLCKCSLPSPSLRPRGLAAPQSCQPWQFQHLCLAPLTQALHIVCSVTCFEGLLFPMGGIPRVYLTSWFSWRSQGLAACRTASWERPKQDFGDTPFPMSRVCYRYLFHLLVSSWSPPIFFCIFVQ